MICYLIVSLFGMAVMAFDSPENHRNFIPFYQITKYSSIPKRQTVIVGQSLETFDTSTSNDDEVSVDNNLSSNYDHNSQNREQIEFRDTGRYVDTNNNQNSKAEGSLCRRSFDGKNGYCILAYQCLHVVREFRKHRTKIDVCSYQKNIPIICCPLMDKYSTAPIESVQRISAQKCAEREMALQRPQRRYHSSAKKCESSVPLIVGGERTFPGEYPHMAAIGWTKPTGFINWACGGALITRQYVLTAAHCTKFRGKPPDRVRLGGHNLYTNTDIIPQDFQISDIIIHPAYTIETYYNDIALLKLSKTVQFTEVIKPACLWQDSSKFQNEIEIATAIGWGRTQFLGPKSEELLKVDLNIISTEYCNKLYEKELKLPDGILDQEQFCAGYLEGGKDTCQGDSGGPIHIQMPKYNCINYIIGVTSFGKYCAAPNSPGVYTKVSAYLDWIEEVAFNDNNQF